MFWCCIFEGQWVRCDYFTSSLWLFSFQSQRESLYLSRSQQPAVEKGRRAANNLVQVNARPKINLPACFPAVCAMFLRLFIYFHCGAAEIEKLLCQQPSVLCRIWGVIIAVRCFSSTNPAVCFPHAVGENACSLFYLGEWCKIHSMRCVPTKDFLRQFASLFPSFLPLKNVLLTIS